MRYLLWRLSDTPPPTPPAPERKFVQVNARLFASDVETLRQIAADRGTSFPLELRALVHRALRDGVQNVVILREDGGAK